MAQVNAAQPLPERRSSGLVAAEAMMVVSGAMLNLEDAAAGLATLAANDATAINKTYYDPKTGKLAQAQAKVVQDEGTPHYEDQGSYKHTGWCYHYKKVEVTNPDGTTSEIWEKDTSRGRYWGTESKQYHDPKTTYKGAASAEQTGDDTRQVSIITAQAQSAVSEAQTLAQQTESASTNDGQQAQIDTNTLSSALGIMSTLTQLLGQIY